jgi:glucoamylase
MVGASQGSSRLWFTLAQGIVTEIYYPRIDIPQIKDLGFIIADNAGFWVEVRRLDNYEVKLAEPGLPAVEVVHRHSRFTFTMEICPSQRRDVLLLRYRLEGDPSLRPYALLATRLGGDAAENIASVGKHGSRKVLWAEQGPFSLALCAADELGADDFLRCSVGEFGVSDGWQNFSSHGRMTWQYDSAGPGCVALMGELSRGGRLALGFSTSMDAAATLAVSSLMDDFSAEWQSQCDAWRTFQAGLQPPALPEDLHRALMLSAAVLKIHEDRTYRGAAVASLSVPWGDASDSRGGYHLVWPRDLVETAGALVALKEYHTARDVLRYLIATQQEDGRWFQNQWLGGAPFWTGVQLDEAAFPVLLATMLHDCGELHGIPIADMIERALRFIAGEGPSTRQDRWEENAGLNTFTLAVAIAALVEGSAFLPEEEKAFALLLADYWNARLEDWAFVCGTALARDAGVEGYYIRTVPLNVETEDCAPSEVVLIKNLAHDPSLPASAQISTDFLQLVRYGLRAADDPHISNSLVVVDKLLETKTPNGSVWHRYNSDGYGEHDDGTAFDGTGRGRGWPLLVGERGHHALCIGDDVLPYLRTMLAMGSPLGLLPEQVWDQAPIPEKGLYPGKPSGSAMPLVWAHAEFIKLCYGRELGYPVDRPSATWQRYRGVRPTVKYLIWGPKDRSHQIRRGSALYFALESPARVHWGTNGWQNIQDADTAPENRLGLNVVKIDLDDVAIGSTVQFTFFWKDRRAWEGRDYALTVEADAPD